MTTEASPYEQEATFREFVDTIHALELKALRMERRALSAELKLKFWEKFEDYFCVGRK